MNLKFKIFDYNKVVPKYCKICSEGKPYLVKQRNFPHANKQYSSEHNNSTFSGKEQLKMATKRILWEKHHLLQ